jgi:PAS domain S-box-containing protein
VEVRRLRILLVEDREEEAQLIQRLLRAGLGDEALHADRVVSLAEALASCSQAAYDLVLLDHRVAGQEGGKALEELRRRGVSVPVILLTESADEPPSAEPLPGVFDCLPKAKLNPSSLARAVRHATSLKEQEDGRLRAEAALRKLSRAVEESADMVLITNCQGVIEYVNPAFEGLTGYTREEAVGKTPRILKSSLQDSGFYGELWKTVLAGRVFRGVLINRKKNGDLYYADKTVTPVRDPNGVITHFISNDRDITDRRKAEEALRCSERRYRMLFERNLAGVFRSTGDGRLLECNEALVRMFGYDSRAELLQQPVSRLYQDPEQGQKMLQRLCQEGQLVNQEICGRRKDKSTVWLLANISLLAPENGEPAGSEGTILDVTEKRRLAEQLAQAQKMDAVGRLAGGIAHDFNNLLMVISSYSELMLDALEPGHALERNAKEILRASRRAADLTRQLLAFSRKQVQALQVLDLNAVLNETARMLTRLIGEDIQLVIEPEASVWRIKVDPAQLEQVLMNLAANARDAMPLGGKLTLETINVHLEEAEAGLPAGDYVQLAVQDSGRGMEAEVLPKIFEPFFTTKEKGRGTGLGLASVYGIVQQNGGCIRVQSEPGLGTTFRIYFPRARWEGAGVVADLSGEVAQAGSETILLVEDEEPVRESLCQYLSRCGYRVLTAADGLQALHIAEHDPGTIHLMVTDVVMPNQGGCELARQLAARRPDTKVLFVSGYAEKTVLQHGEIDLAARFLQKPFTLRNLARKVREVLESEGTAAQSERNLPGAARRAAAGTGAP